MFPQFHTNTYNVHTAPTNTYNVHSATPTRTMFSQCHTNTYNVHTAPTNTYNVHTAPTNTYNVHSATPARTMYNVHSATPARTMFTVPHQHVQCSQCHTNTNNIHTTPTTAPALCLQEILQFFRKCLDRTRQNWPNMPNQGRQCVRLLCIATADCVCVCVTCSICTQLYREFTSSREPFHHVTVWVCTCVDVCMCVCTCV